MDPMRSCSHPAAVVAMVFLAAVACEDEAEVTPTLEPAPTAEPAPGEAAPPSVAPPAAAPVPKERLPVTAQQLTTGHSPFRFIPAVPKAGESVRIEAGPITFRNGCLGIADVVVLRKGNQIELRWTPKEVPPDAMCTMGIHEEMVVAQTEALEAGVYTIIVGKVGAVALTVVE